MDVGRRYSDDEPWRHRSATDCSRLRSDFADMDGYVQRVAQVRNGLQWPNHHGTQTFAVAITVMWSDGVSVLSQAVPCDSSTLGACTLALGPAQGWTSGPHPVEQIEPVPYAP